MALFHYVTDDEAEPLTLKFKDVGFGSPVHVRDLWAHKDLGVLRDSYTVTVPQGGVVMLRIWQQLGAQTGDTAAYLSAGEGEFRRLGA